MISKFSIHEINKDNNAWTMGEGPYSVNSFVFCFLAEGEAFVEVDGNGYLLRAGQSLFIPENTTIIVKHLRDFKGYYGLFQLEFLNDASYPVLHSGKPHLQTFWFDDALFMLSILHRMAIAYDDKDTLFLKKALDLIISQLRADSNVAVIPEKFLQMVFDFNDTPKTVSEYASILMVSPNYLNKTVKQHTRRTAIDWIEIARLNLAETLLKNKSIPIGDIAGRVGIDDQSYFARFFKKKTGLTPSQFRNIT